MVAVHTGVGQAAEAGEVLALLGQQVKVGAVPIRAGLIKLRHHAQGHMNGQQAARGLEFSGVTKGWQAKQGATGAKKTAAVHGIRAWGGETAGFGPVHESGSAGRGLWPWFAQRWTR